MELSFQHISKAFAGAHALDDVSFTARPGEVHALLGENGAGKSTLLKILSGVHRPDAGEVRIGGTARHFRAPADALHAGVAVIYQELQLIPQLSVAENVFLGHLPAAGGLLRSAELNERAAVLLDRLGERVSPKTRLADLPIGIRQIIEIAKALARNATILAFDEPTSSLSSRETERLFGVIGQLRREGKTVLYVSHRLAEIYRLCDAATVLRDGRFVESFPSVKDVPEPILVHRMVGRELTNLFDYRPRPIGEPVLEACGLTGPGLRTPADLTLRRGEIVGIFGLVGAGRTEFMKLISGIHRRTGGTVRVAGRVLAGRGPVESVRAGLIYVPEDRKKEGIVAVASVVNNTNLSVRRLFSPGRSFIARRRERANAERYREALGVRTSSIDKPIGLLSGGNQQKVILGRALSEQPKAILLDEPTRGIDVGAKADIYHIVHDLAERGVAVAIVSSELAEVLGVCDRVLVMSAGRIVGELPRERATQEALLAMALPRDPQPVDAL